MGRICRIFRILSDFTVEIEHLLTSAAAVVHVCRVKPYADASAGTPVQMQEVAEFTNRIWYSVDNTLRSWLHGKVSLQMEIPGNL